MAVSKHEIKAIAMPHLVFGGRDRGGSSAMAKTVGLTCGVATEVLLTQGLVSRGVFAPVVAELYDPVLNKLSEHGLNFALTLPKNVWIKTCLCHYKPHASRSLRSWPTVQIHRRHPQRTRTSWCWRESRGDWYFTIFEKNSMLGKIQCIQDFKNNAVVIFHQGWQRSSLVNCECVSDIWNRD
jgi:hypothetical protein